MIEQYVNGIFWDVIGFIVLSIMGYIAMLLRTSVKRMELYDLALFGNTETRTPGLLDKLCEHEKRLDNHRAAIITTISDLAKKGVVVCDGDIRDAVKDLKAET